MKLTRGWWGSGLGSYLPCEHTYQLYDLDLLPPVAAPAGYAWLAGADPIGQPMEPAKMPADVPAGLAFDAFFARPELQSAFSSPTDCYWKIEVSFTPEAFGEGARLVQFLADSQGCLYWYLLVQPGGPQPVLAGHAEDYDLVQVAGGFDEFLRRFWVENVAWHEIVQEGRSPDRLSAPVRDYVAHFGG